MNLKNIIQATVKKDNFDGMITATEKEAGVVWWKKGNCKINKFWIDVKVSKTIVFSCVNGKLRLF